MTPLTPREIVSELDRFIIGQQEAKQAVAVALRNRYRRKKVKGQMQEESSDSDEPSLSDVRGALNMETLVFNPSVLWNRGNGFAWVFDLNLSLFQDATAQGNAMFPITIDERTSGRAVVQARAEADLTAQGARNMSISALWWWSTFHLKLGLTMGHLMVPYLNIFLMEEDGQLYKATLPKLDLYWRF